MPIVRVSGAGGIHKLPFVSSSGLLAPSWQQQSELALPTTFPRVVPSLALSQLWDLHAAGPDFVQATC